MTLINVAIGLITFCYPAHKLPSSPRQLYRKIQVICHNLTTKDSDANRSKIFEQIARDFRQKMRSHATTSIPRNEEIIRLLDSYIDEHQNSDDPKVRATVKDFRLYKKDAEADIRWYRRILAATDSDPLPIPE